MFHRHSLRPRPRTFSIVARDAVTGELGVAVASRYLAVGALVPYAIADVGSIAIQADLDPADAPKALALLREGIPSSHVLKNLVADLPAANARQIAIVDVHGGASAYSGSLCMGWSGHRTGLAYACQGNVLAGEEVLSAMAQAYETTKGDLATRLIASLLAGDHAGGDRRGKQSASVFVVKRAGGYAGASDTVVDLRVDDHPNPVGELERLDRLHKLYFQRSPLREKLSIVGDVLVELQVLMRRAGYLKGGREGMMCAETRSALIELVGVENFEERVDVEGGTIDAPCLMYLRERFA